MRVLYLIGIWLRRKIDSYLENINSQDVLKGLDFNKCFQILKGNKTPNKFSTDQLKITFKYLNFVREPFWTCSKIHTLVDFKHLNFRIFSFSLYHKYLNNLC